MASRWAVKVVRSSPAKGRRRTLAGMSYGRVAGGSGEGGRQVGVWSARGVWTRSAHNCLGAHALCVGGRRGVCGVCMVCVGWEEGCVW